MRAAIFNPYLDTLGGGERYTMAFAQALVANGYSVFVQWPNTLIKKKLEQRFGIKLDGVEFIKDIKRGDGYDICFWVSDGSIPLLRAHKNFLHFQTPFKDVDGKSLLNRMKLFRIDKIICNSYFTKGFIDEEYAVKSLVIYPPVAVGKIRPGGKENIILNVGRFSQLQQAKRQDVLISAFKQLFNEGVLDWKLILAGGTEIGVDYYIEKLRKAVKDYPIQIIESPTFAEIKDLYGKAKIFWAATGFGIEEKRSPMGVEHFGITLVEAMSGGAVPIAYCAGGHKEIIADGDNGYLWRKKRELLAKTRQLIANERLWKSLSSKAKKDSRVYEYERFEAEIAGII